MSKKAKRIQQKERHIKRQVAIAAMCGLNWHSPQKHRYHKKTAVNCGQPGCIYCANPRRVWGAKTMQERRFECLEEDNPRKDSWIGVQEWEDLSDPNMEWDA